MTSGKRDVVRSWLVKALHDILAAKQLASAEKPLLDVAIYHCQQGAEKAVKAFLVYHDVRLEKTHNISALVSRAVQLERGFNAWNDAAEYLTPYAEGFRYPGEALAPSVKEFRKALQFSEDLYAFVLAHLPEETHPA